METSKNGKNVSSDNGENEDSMSNDNSNDQNRIVTILSSFFVNIKKRLKNLYDNIT